MHSWLDPGPEVEGRQSAEWSSIRVEGDGNLARSVTAKSVTQNQISLKEICGEFVLDVCFFLYPRKILF